jgi:hypothetical protein
MYTPVLPASSTAPNSPAKPPFSFLTSPARLPVIRHHSGFQSVAGKNDGMTGKMRKT